VDIDLDSEADKRPQIFKLIKEKYGYDRVLNIITFKTLKPKASILTAGRGLGYNNDEVQAISDMIPVERGEQWSLKDCVEGNEELERKPLKEFINLINQYKGLLESALDLEGLIVGRSIHASGLYIFNDNYIKQNSLMKSPSGEDTTCWSMSDSDYCGALKVDELTIEALDKIRSCLDLLMKDKKIEWQGTLRDTYNKYLHPDKIIYENDDMYKLLYNGDIINAFQYEGSVGEQALRKIQPHKFAEIIAGNSIMRLANKGGEQPLDKYARFKNNINLWYEEMHEAKLNDKEIKLMEKHLKHLYGVADTQEIVMMLSMDENISNFSLKDANKLRKGIAKKKKKIIEECKNMFFEKGLENGTRIELLNYVWDKQITPQLGYSFSVNHTTPYSGILLQEMNLAYLYGDMYWKCACLSVNAGAIGEGKSTDYGKIAKAVSEMNNLVDAPNINYSEEGFTIFNNKILFGLKAIGEVGEADIELIKNTRPFKSYDDFILRCGDDLSKATIANLIKCGALDDMGNRKELMSKYLDSICEYKDNFTLSNIPMLLSLNLIDATIYKKELLAYNLYKNICTKPNLTEKIKGEGEWYKISNNILDSFLNTYNELKEDVDYKYSDKHNCYIGKKAKIEKCRDKLIERMVNEILNNSQIKNNYNTLKLQELKNKYAKGNIGMWEMSSMNYYKTEHELSYVNKERYAIENFFDLPEDPIVNESWITREGREFKRYKLSLIMGTVLHRDKAKHTVSLLTTDGVVTVKYYDGLFNHYNKTISEIQPNGKKKRIEESWFKRGEKCIIYGFRNGDQFFPRKYKNSVFQHTTMKILEVNESNGEVKVQMERYRA
jgi:DNA polymerase-3 subunit alpha